MFRRKEDSDLPFDEATGSKPAGSEGGSSSSSSSAPASSASGSGASSSSSSSAPTTAYQPARPVATPVASSAPTASAPSAYRPATTSEMPRPRAPEPRSPISSSSPTVQSGDKKGSRRILTVGNDILLKGEIATCDRLVIEGKVDAKLNDVHTVEIAETGSFKGTAEVEDAEISGLFEGDLIVRNRLVIYSTGKVRGKITYGEIEIERGGELTGEIKTVSGAGAKGFTSTPATATTTAPKSAVA